MGSFLSLLKKEALKIKTHPNSKYVNTQMQNLRHHYSSFVSICEDCGIDWFSYSEIFDGDFDSFKIWEQKDSKKVDAHQLFSGLILFSNGKFEDKIQFLFEMFDLNEEEILSYQALQLLIINCCTATFKVFQIEATIQQQELQIFLNKYFCLESQIAMKQLILWAMKSQEVIQFFKSLNLQIPQKAKNLPIVNLFKYTPTPRSKCILKQPFFNLYRKQLIDDYSAIASIYQYLQQPDINVPVNQFHPINEWIFGIRCDDIRQPLSCLITADEQAANQKLLYFVGRLVVIYYPRLQSQQYYFNHKREVTCLKISKNKLYVASGEHGDDPKIHIWNLKTKQTIKILEQIHRHTIVALQFVCNDNHLVSASDTHQFYPFAVQNIKTGQLLFSGQLTGYLVNLMQNISNPNESSFTFVCNDAFYCFLYSQQAFVRTYKHIPNKQDQFVDAVYYYENNSYTLVLSSLKNKLYFYTQKQHRIVELFEKIVSLKVLQKHLYAMSEKGLYQIQLKNKDVRRIKLDMTFGNDSLIQLITAENSLYLLSSLGLLYNFTVQNKIMKKIPQIFKLENPKAVYHFQKNNELYYSSGRLLWIIDTLSKQLKSLTSYNSDICSIYVDQNNIILGSEQGNLLIYKDGSKQPLIKQLQHPVRDITLTKKQSNSYTSLVILVDKSVIVINYEELVQMKEHRLENLKLCKIAKSSEDNLMLGITSQRQLKMYKAECQSFKQLDSMKKSEFIRTIIDGRPILFHPVKNLFIVSGRKGQIYFWNDYFRAKQGKDLIQSLGGHSSEIFQLIEYKNYEGFISIGATDQMVALWHSKYKHQRFLNKAKNILQHPIFQLQFNSGIELQQNPEQLRDSFAIIKSVADKCHNQIIQQILLPDNSKYEPLLDKNKTKQQLKLAPLVSIKLSHVIGFQCSNIRKSIFFCHSYLKPDQNSKSSKQTNKHKSLTSNVKNELFYSKQHLIPYVQVHENCTKKLVYFVDRICIVQLIPTKQQKFYEHHKNNITAICVHPSKELVCSVQCPSLTNDSISTIINRAKIHIWNSQTLKRQFVIEHYNTGVVHRVEFSRNGKYLCTLTKLTKQDTSSIQIYDWQNNLFIAQRVFPKQILLDVQFNPYKPMEMAIVGVGIVAILEIKNTLLIVKQRHCHSNTETTTCLAHVYNCYGDSIESDIVTGNSEGDISLLICGQYVKVRQKAHVGIINCLRVAQLFHYMMVLITGGQDQFIRIWTTKMKILISINLKNLPCFGGNLTQMYDCQNFAPQSLDIYHCFSELKNQKNISSDLLVSTRGGDIIELNIKYELQQTHTNITNKKLQQQTKLDGIIRYDSKVYLRNVSSENLLGFSIYRDLMLTFSQKEYIYFWDLIRMQLLTVKKVRSVPSVVKFSNSGELFVIGYQTGEIELFQTSIQKQIISIQTIPNQGASIVNIVFSTSDKKMLVSLINYKHSKQSGIDDFNCQVHAYIKNSGKESIINKKDANKFNSKIELNNKNLSKNMGVYFMDFSSNEKVALLRYQPMKNNKRIYHERQNKFIMWNIEQNQIIQNNECNAQFNNLNFCNSVNTSYNYKQMVDSKFKQQSLQAQVSQMAQYERYVSLGMTNGEIILTQASAFYNQKIDNSLGKIYKAHASGIQYMKVEGGYLYTSAFKHKNIMVWKLEQQKQQWDYDSGNLTLEDKYCEKCTKQRLNKYLNDIFPKRNKIFQIAGNTKSQQKLPVKIKLNKVLGRNALYKRNNLFYDFNDFVITHSGCNILIMSKEQDEPLQQKVFPIDKNLNFSLPQISAIAISNNRKLLAIGTFSQESKIFIWDISSQTTIFELNIKQIAEISLLRFSDNCKFIVCTGLSLQNTLVVFLVDVKKSSIIACHDMSYSLNTKIHDIIFVPNQQSAFITCGLHSVVGWNYLCGLFTSDMYQVEIQENLRHFNKEPVNFYSMIFVIKTLVTATSDGHIYIWKNKKAVKKQSAHPNHSVLVLHTTVGSQIFASGGTDGRVIFWQLSGDVVHKLYQFQVCQTKKQIAVTLKYHIQSIFIGRQKIIVGTRCGDIYEFDKPKQNLGKSNNKSKRLILPSFNHQKIVSICFSSSSRWFYLLTQKGCFQIYEIQTLNKLYSKQLLQNLEHHKLKSILKMFVCIESDLIYIIYKQEVEVYELKKEKLVKSESQPDQLKDVMVKLTSSVNKQIIEAILSPNQKYLALLINADKNLKIIIFTFPKIQKDKLKEWFKKSHTIEIFSQLYFFDFSNDSNYFLRVHNQNSFTIDLKDFKQLPSASQQTIEWVGQGKLKLQAFKDIYIIFRNAKHKLLQVVQIMNKCVIVTDEVGSLLVFGYPAKGYVQAHFYHLNNVYICKVSPDNKTLITVSQFDKSIHIWNIEEDQQQQLQKKRTYPSIFEMD